MNQKFRHSDLLKSPSSVRPYDIFGVTGCCLWTSILWGWPLPRSSASTAWSGWRQTMLRCGHRCVISSHVSSVHMCLCARTSFWGVKSDCKYSLFCLHPGVQTVCVWRGEKKMLHSLTFLVKTQNRRGEGRRGQWVRGGGELGACGEGGVIISTISKNRELGYKKEAALLKITAP